MVRIATGIAPLFALLFATALTASTASAQMVPNPIYAGGFEPADFPATDADAARFLTQASFGRRKRDRAGAGHGLQRVDRRALATPARSRRPYLGSSP
jgi:hypothetical protein